MSYFEFINNWAQQLPSPLAVFPKPCTPRNWPSLSLALAPSIPKVSTSFLLYCSSLSSPLRGGQSKTLPHSAPACVSDPIATLPPCVSLFSSRSSVCPVLSPLHISTVATTSAQVDISTTMPSCFSESLLLSMEHPKSLFWYSGKGSCVLIDN